MEQVAIRPIHSDEQHAAALTEFETYFDNEPAPGSVEADRFELLGIVIERYEESRWPVEAPKPVDALRFAMEQSGRTQSDLADLFGSRSRASEVLSGKRGLSIEQIKRLAREWRIPVALLIGDLEHA
jgi:HTH-type transcriptional regulator/antitoxin HigA